MRTAMLLTSLYLLAAPLWAGEPDPLQSPQWETMHARFLDGEAYVFDGKMSVLAPETAEDSLNVPVTFDATALDGVERVVVMADLNPIPGVLEFRPQGIPARLSFRMKLQQGSPVRAAARTADGVWHVGGVWVDAAGGGCTLPSFGTASGDWTSNLGKVSAHVWRRADNNRLRVRVMHPMDTGLAAGIPAFHIEDMNILDEASGAVLAGMSLYEPVSENPMLSLDVGQHTGFRVEGRDNNGNRIEAEVLE